MTAGASGRTSRTPRKRRKRPRSHPRRRRPRTGYRLLPLLREPVRRHMVIPHTHHTQLGGELLRRRVSRLLLRCTYGHCHGGNARVGLGRTDMMSEAARLVLYSYGNVFPFMYYNSPIAAPVSFVFYYSAQPIPEPWRSGCGVSVPGMTALCWSLRSGHHSADHWWRSYGAGMDTGKP
jgi:hypothetical protein